ncbi:hypothetical protein DFQ26_006248 [Actinomortierella ambigua]|nr:hypothetical protein DFQ26_006248 [Actinomortierella ambigua]
MAPNTHTFKRILANNSILGANPEPSHFRVVTVTEPIPELKPNELFVKNLSFSLDPYIRYEFAKGQTESPVIGFGLSRVLESANPSFPKDSLILAPVDWAEYSHISSSELLIEVVLVDRTLPYADKVSLSAYHGVLGVPGLTAWHSLRKIGDLKAGETIYVSSAAGTLGQLVGQLAKRKGLRVIGSAGSQAKIDYLTKELGYDYVFNYKTADKRQALTEAVGDKGLDIYYDLVGDETTEVVLDLLNPRGRILAVGILAEHQGQKTEPPKNLINILFKQLRYEGYVIFGNAQEVPAFWEELLPLVANGDIKYTEHIVKLGQGGLEAVPQTYINLLKGVYQGKVSVDVASE